MMNKKQEWFSKSKKILSEKIKNSISKTDMYLDELNLRESCIDKPNNLGVSLTSEIVCGKYKIIGGNSSSSIDGYEGELELKFEDNKFYGSWIVEESQIHEGSGFIIDNYLTLQFDYIENGAIFTGVVTYEFLSEEIIKGTWTESISDNIGFEMGRKITSN